MRARLTRGTLLLAALALAAVLALSGCGGSDDNGGSASSGSGGSAGSNGSSQKGASGPGGPLTVAKGVPPQVGYLRQQFPVPEPTPGSKKERARSKKAIKAGRAACKGKTPLQVRDEFIDEAESEGNLEPDSPQAKMIDRLPHYQKQAKHDPSFVAGQLGALTYQMTLPEKTAQDGYRGCVYELARTLEKQILKQKK